MTRDDETFIRAKVHEAVAKLQPTPVPTMLELREANAALARYDVHAVRRFLTKHLGATPATDGPIRYREEDR